MTSSRSRHPTRGGGPASLLLLAAMASPVVGQSGNVGLSAVGARRFGNDAVGVFEPGVGDRLGDAIAIGDFNGDGADDLATAAPGHSSSDGAHSGCGVVVVRFSVPAIGLEEGGPSHAISQEAVGNPDPAEEHDAFGRALAVCDFDGDGHDDLAVGVPGESLGPADSAGAVEIRYGSSAGLSAVAAQFLTQESGAIPGDSEPGDFFGGALACGRFDGDAFADLAIGIWDESFLDGSPGELSGAGAVVVLRGSAAGVRTDGVALFHQGLDGLEDTVGSFDYFGAALAVGDFDGDGFDDLAIGAPGEDNSNDDVGGRGAIHVLFGGATGLSADDEEFWTESELGGSSEDGDHFGGALAAGDFDGDGFDDLAIGVPDEDLPEMEDAGQLIALYGSAGGFAFARTQFWTEDAIHGAGTSEDDDAFGDSIASGDFDRDGRDDLAIGHPGELALAPYDGQVTVVMGTPTGISNGRRRRLASGFEGGPGVPDQAHRNYGEALGIGDFDGDGYADLAVGAPHEDEGELEDVGAEFVYYGSLFSDGFDSLSTSFWSLVTP
jgi:hypothetical protein